MRRVRWWWFLAMGRFVARGGREGPGSKMFDQALKTPNHKEGSYMKPRFHRSMKVVTVLFLGAISFLPSTLAAAGRDENPSVLFDSLTSWDWPIHRQGGEMQIQVPRTYKTEGGALYRISLVFMNEEDYRSFSARKIKYRISLQDLDWFTFFVEDRVLVSYEKESMIASLDEVFAAASASLCGDVVAKGIIEIFPEIFIGVNIHSRLFSPAPDDPHGKSLPPPGHCEEGCELDVTNECDFFAIGGCGGPTCIIACITEDCKPFGGAGNCNVVEVPIFPDFCLCS
jgi:hypothetical protein